MKSSLFAKFTLALGLTLSLSACEKVSQSVEQTPQHKVVFLAGATGVIGTPLSKLLVEKGYTVYGTTRSEEKAKLLEKMGVKPVIVNVYDKDALEKAVVEAKPDVVINQLSDLPHGLKEEEMKEGLKRDDRIRIEGTKNLIRATEKAGAKTYIGQSVAMLYAPSDKPYTENSAFIDTADELYGKTIEAAQSLEKQILDSKLTGVVLRYGWLYGPKTGFEQAVDGYPSLHVDAAALAAVEAINATQSGVYHVAEDSPLIDVNKFKMAFPQWKADFRLNP